MSDDPYDRDENAFRTDGRDVCHWCSLRPQSWVWGPYGTRVCDYCDELFSAGRGAEVVEEIAARLTVRGDWQRWQGMVDEERWRSREHGLVQRWLAVRTERRPV